MRRRLFLQANVCTMNELHSVNSMYTCWPLKIVNSIDIPIVAIGGITLENAQELKDTGISGFSVVSAIMSAKNPQVASKKLKEIYFS